MRLANATPVNVLQTSIKTVRCLTRYEDEHDHIKLCAKDAQTQSHQRLLATFTVQPTSLLCCLSPSLSGGKMGTVEPVQQSVRCGGANSFTGSNKTGEFDLIKSRDWFA